MKRWITVGAAVALMSVTLTALAAGKTLEERCRAQAEKHQISADKLDAYVKTCVEKHHRRKRPAATTAPAPASAPASAPAEPAK